jgi:glycosyltransferase involved in cell wall biosynthesis
LLTKLAVHVIKKATLTVVSNERLKTYVEQIGGSAFSLPDPVPTFDIGTCEEQVQLRGRYNVLFICTYAKDEPYLEVIKAAGELSDDIVMYITGNNKDRIAGIPNNVVMTGYLPEHEYLRLLHAVDLVIDLTTREDCLVCGAYEAVAAEKPVILSDTKALREYFYKGALYVDNSSSDVVDKINEAIGTLAKLKQEIREIREERVESWLNQKVLLEGVLNDMSGDMT